MQMQQKSRVNKRLTYFDIRAMICDHSGQDSLHVERLPEGLFLATSDELEGLVAQGRTVAEALDIARDVGAN